ncbi:isochorismate synthase [Morganella psychrotolerans]|uniref:Isochorismate synthase MenF n=1 Tax=Morganella psychrotolerans TaxID=368603 RepID=A0A5M9R955_9GAMM|nr:isochorismate synthase [Morganella psychrotolerans]KAA8716829.1 isochorismate synthase [Morganella psychrotolerans]
MILFSDFISQVCAEITHNKNETNGIYQYAVTLPPSLQAALPVTDWPGWLNGQICYPQFYWQHRDGTDIAAVCGELCRFTHINEAQAVLDTLPEQSNIRIWGLNSWQFDAISLTPEQGTGGSYLFIPRAELRCVQGNIQFLVNIDSRRPAEETVTFLRSLCGNVIPPVLETTVLSAEHQPDKAGWMQLVRTAVTAISGGLMEKVVTARKTVLRLSAPVRPLAFMQASRDCNHHCYHYMLATAPDNAFMASPPERLYLRTGAQLCTEALAGTVAGYPDDARAEAAARWLLADKKNVHENSVVVDDICQRLSGAVNTLKVSDATVIRLRKVQHLYRTISATLYTPRDNDCLQRLQPTAAVAGLPRTAALAFLRKNEPFERNWYAGSGGWCSPSQSEFAVSLRCAQIHGSQIDLYAGAGIVAGSDPQAEWNEIENKAAGLRTLLEGEPH